MDQLLWLRDIFWTLCFENALVMGVDAVATMSQKLDNTAGLIDSFDYSFDLSASELLLTQQ